MNKIIESILYIIVGVIILIVVEFKIIQFAELITLILGFVGFAALLNGVFGIFSALTQKKESDEFEDTWN